MVAETSDMSRGYKVFLLCLCGLFFGVGALLFRNCFIDILRYRNVSSWERKQAHVTSTRVYEYDNPHEETTSYERDAFGDRRRVTHNPGEPDTYFAVEVCFQYDVDETVYRGEINDSGHQTHQRAEHTARTRYPPGAVIEIAYDPERPANHWAIHHDPNPLRVAYGGIVMGAIFMSPILVYVGYRLYSVVHRQSGSTSV